MTFPRVTTLTSAFALLAGPALAQVSADDVWNDWQEIFANYGMELTTEGQSSSGGIVTVMGASLGAELPEGNFLIELGDLTFAETGSGTVRVSMAVEAPIRVDVTDEEGQSATITMVFRQDNGEMIVSGDPDAIRYDFAYPSVSVTDFDVEGEDIPADFPAVIEVTATDMTGFLAMKDGDLRNYDSSTSIASMVADISMDVPESEGGGAFDMSFNIADLQQTVSGTLGIVDMEMSAAEMINGGLAQDSTATHGAASYSINVDGPEGAFAMEAGASSGTLDMTMDEAGISYSTSANDVTVALSGDMIPLPSVNLSMTESGGTFTMPVVPGDDPQDYGLVMRMVGLEIDDMIWGLFDPSGQLPRDPATMIVDLGGQAVVSEDFTSPEFAENPMPGMPGSVETLKVNALQLSLAGAELTGNGDFEFDNSMGMPMPFGVANLSLTGGNTLLDTLVNMGLLPQEQAMGARMMLGMFARPGPGEDSLTSQIEMTKDGQILANGQRIR